MNEYIKRQIFKILIDENIDKEKVNKILENINILFTPSSDEDDLPKSINVITPLFTGSVYLSEQGGKYFYKDDIGGIILHPSSKKVMRQKINKYLGKEG